MGRILLVSYYWPPAGGAGVQRWLKLVKYLVRLGWKVTVYTPRLAEYPEYDESLLADVPSEVEILTHRIVEPFALYNKLVHRGRRSELSIGLVQENTRRSLLQRLLFWVRANVFVPDGRCLWIKPSVRFLRTWLREHPQDAVVTTGPPHSLHLIGRKLKRKLSIRWVADFRDPWLHIDYQQHLPLTTYTQKRLQRMERTVVEEADAVVVVSEGMQTDFADYSPRRILTIPNGYDTEDFPQLGVAWSRYPFRLVYAGAMNGDRNPELLWKALQILKDEKLITPDSFRVELVGRSDARVRESVRVSGLDDYVDFRKGIAHSAVPELLQGASMLLLCVNRAPGSKAILTGKLFEYLASERPIVVLGPCDGEAVRLVESLGVGRGFEDKDDSALVAYLRESLELARDGCLEVKATEAKKRYTREYQAGQFSALFNSML